ncbi:hypothetical protein [Streptomyces sp. NL15-2K]|uniref:hypothetical protein n=1 Tax=Streptomyces sp. NL15-2K TaxID=376149 RepID=UPI000F565B4E|nr:MULTISPECIES: hypothetical protein [Actinomycetes]WKX06665.1 hypothetical protein Q4V64_03815 [Kutzneria buriramensis]GCB43691.1 hypothetical protein SNL152K_976 [Streptomyces sp. NL15-2K]
MRSKVLGAVVGVAVVVVPLVLVTHELSGTESTTSLDKFSAVTIDGQQALKPNIVAGRTLGMYHPLPWVGTSIGDLSCPAALKAVAGATLTCHGTSADGSLIDVPVRTVSATSDSITWVFER